LVVVLLTAVVDNHAQVVHRPEAVRAVDADHDQRLIVGPAAVHQDRE
jgi:hypothetical protein